MVKNLRPNWTAKIPLEAFEKSTVKANDDEHKTKGDEASADGKHTVDDTLFEKPMLPRRSNEEIENCSVRSKDISIDDMGSLEGDEMAKLSHKVDIKSRKQQNNEEENGDDHEGKHEEQDSEESRKDDTEKEDVFDESLENAYGMEVVQEATTSSYCKKCEVNFKNKRSSEDI